jgi:phosphatidylserine/phosphatidylglycerophosphate/cardiolipin synthase-like enzyme
MDAVRDTRAQGGRATLFFDALAALDERPNFTLAALARSDAGGAAHDVYVHAKMMLVDDAWATIGSANILTRSFHADTELNASFWHLDTIHALRTELLAEHLGVDTRELGLAAALRLFAERARRNRLARSAAEPMAGLAWMLDGNRYGLEQASG